MKLLKQSQRQQPKISLILLDWNVRESFHLLHYLSQQTLARDLFEVIIIEYYSGVSDAIKKFEEQVDTWALLEMPSTTYYHKHLMYNAGILLSRGEIVIICDSDAMAKPTFLDNVIQAFETNQNIVLHIDQYRNNRRDLYPFNYPDFEEVIGPGCINYENGKTTGLSVTSDIIHHRNYGACFCAKRTDLIAIGGADEHIDFIGHICGPYDLTFRLLNIGCKEIWHETEFLYHTWHPGQAGVDNYLGPHDGRHMSTTALEVLTSMRVQPHVINPMIAKLQQNKKAPSLNTLMRELISPDHCKVADRSFLESLQCQEWAKATYQSRTYHGCHIRKHHHEYWVHAAVHHPHLDEDTSAPLFITSAPTAAEAWIDTHFHWRLKLIPSITLLYMTFNIVCRRLNTTVRKIDTQSLSVTHFIKPILRKLKNIYQEHVFFIAGMRALLLNLHLLKKSSSQHAITLILSTKNELSYLRIATFLKTIPKIPTIYVESSSVLASSIATWKSTAQSNDIVVLSRQTYIEYMAQLTEMIKSDKVLVL